MSRPESLRYEPHRRIRLLQGPLFGIACFLATLSGVVVLSVLLGSLVAAVLHRPGGRPWHHVAGNTRDLFLFLRGLTTQLRDSDPALAGFRAGIAGSLWLLGLVPASRSRVGWVPPCSSSTRLRDDRE